MIKMALDKLTEIWDRLGLVGKVINLRDRTDRAEHAIKSAKSIGLPIEFYYADKHPEGGVAGCFESHQNVCRDALLRGERRLLVLEDDFEGTEEILKEEGIAALKEAVDFVTTRDDWSIVYLGVLPNIWFEKSERVGPHMYRMKPWACTHAMIVNEAYMKEIVQWKFTRYGKDAYDWRHRKCERAFAFHPQAIKQFDSPSDIRTQMPTPTFLRDLPLNAASWYALNIGISLGHALAVFACIAVIMSFTAADSKTANKKYATKTLERGILHNSVS
jgi:GR25 family glycosyltransferase involved in LPS biosynthesis